MGSDVVAEVCAIRGRIAAAASTLCRLPDSALVDVLVPLRGAAEAIEGCCGREVRLASSAQVLAGDRQIASYIIDRTFDDHKVLLRQRLTEALAELERLRGGVDVRAAELERDAAVAEAARVREASTRAVLEAHSECAALRRVVQASQSAVVGTTIMFHGTMARLVQTFALCEEWRDRQLLLLTEEGLPAVLAASVRAKSALVCDEAIESSRTPTLPVIARPKPSAAPPPRQARAKASSVAEPPVPRPRPDPQPHCVEGGSGIAPAPLHPRHRPQVRRH